MYDRGRIVVFPKVYVINTESPTWQAIWKVQMTGKRGLEGEESEIDYEEKEKLMKKDKQGLYKSV